MSSKTAAGWTFAKLALLALFSAATTAVRTWRVGVMAPLTAPGVGNWTMATVEVNFNRNRFFAKF